MTMPETFKNEQMKPSAIARVLIPLDRTKDEEDKEDKEDAKAEDDKVAEAPPVVLGEAKDYPEIEYEDKVLTLKPVTDGLYVYVMHQAAGRELRKHVCEFVKTHFEKDLGEAEVEEIQKKAEEIAVKVDKVFVQQFADTPLFSYEKN